MDRAIETEPEIDEWYHSLTDDEAGQVDVNIDRLAEQGVLLSEPYSSPSRTVASFRASFVNSGSI